MNRKEELVKELQSNEHIVQIVDAEDLALEWKNIRRGADLVADNTSAVLDLATARKAIRELGGLSPGKVTIKRYAGKEYVIFKGNPRDRLILRGTRYLTSNPKVVRLAVGPKGVMRSVKGGFVISAVLSVGVSVFDHFIRDTSSLHELFGSVSGDLMKIGLASIAAAAGGIVVGSSAVVASIPAAPLIAAISIGILANQVLDRVDSRMGATKALIEGYRKMGVNLDEIRREFNQGMRKIERNPTLIQCLFTHCPSVRRY